MQLTEDFLSRVPSYSVKDFLKIVIDAIKKYTKAETAEDEPPDPILRGLFSLTLLLVRTLQGNSSSSVLLSSLCDDM